MKEKTILTPELKVSDYKTSLDFYTQLAGFVVSYERPEEDFAMLERGGARLMIEGLTDKGRSDIWKVGDLERPFGRGINIQIEVTDVQSLHQSFKNASWPIFFDMEEKWYRADDTELGNKQFLVQDPDGYLLRFFQDLGSRVVKK